ncbi:hypothetical protein NHU_00948 [Rhodovulum sulfidophilum]|uniref:Uncharacterized protein n=1 Tax=Rhodovulum sulfidophilum TaxID=35806 RepID=A0A0D6B078_RHOSU|nr:hypothetical protein NHU_00948 [Rhodovulum sulfidophilum]
MRIGLVPGQDRRRNRQALARIRDAVGPEHQPQEGQPAPNRTRIAVTLRCLTSKRPFLPRAPKRGPANRRRAAGFRKVTQPGASASRP